MIQPQVSSPRAQYLVDGHWVIISPTPLTFKVLCKSANYSKVITVRHPLDILSLRLGCSAFNGHMTLLPYYHKESKYNLTNSFAEFMSKYKVNLLGLWRPLDAVVANSTALKIPEKLVIKDPIPMDKLINELEYMTPIKHMSEPTPYWIYILIIAIISILLATICLFRKRV